MNRNEAILIIIENKISDLSKEEREELILNWWGIDNEDEEFDLLPQKLQQELSESDGPTHNIMHQIYNPLLKMAIKNQFIGVRNEYLSKLVSKILSKEIIVKGRIELLEECPCCHYKTLTERGQYEVCPVCFWEDDGSNDTIRYSYPNHMSIEEYKYTKIKIDLDMSERYVNSFHQDE